MYFLSYLYRLKNLVCMKNFMGLEKLGNFKIKIDRRIYFCDLLWRLRN